jgi:hypothetical protein
VTPCQICQEKADNKADKKAGCEIVLIALYELHDTRKDRNNILSYFANHFKLRPNIPPIPIPESGSKPVHVHFIDTFDNGTDYSDIFQGAPFNPSHTWAVVIGTNDYKESPLEHALQDALNFWDYFSDHGVSCGHVHLLLDNGNGEDIQPVTRRSILDALHDLRNNSAIKPGDTLIIWYSGHGTSYAVRDCWPTTRGAMEAITPVDCGVDPVVPDISDREINLFLANLAEKRGNNITVILNCCFAASVTREQLSTFTDIPGGTALLQPPSNDKCQIHSLGSDPTPMLDAAESYKHKHWAPGHAKSHPDESDGSTGEFRRNPADSRIILKVESLSRFLQKRS